MTAVSEALDERFRAAALALGLPDLAFDTIETEIGPLLAAATERGLALLAFAGEAEAQLGRLARALGPRVLRAPRALDRARSELDEYFAGRRTVFELALDLRGLPPFTLRVLAELARVPYGHTATYRELAVRAGNPNATRAVGSVMNRNRIPIVLPCHRILGSSGALTGYAGGLAVKERLLRLEGALSASALLQQPVADAPDVRDHTFRARGLEFQPQPTRVRVQRARPHRATDPPDIPQQLGL